MLFIYGGGKLITILNSSKQPLTVLDDYFNEEITESINGTYTLKFSTVLDDDKSPYIQTSNFAEVEGQWFNIVKHRRTRSENGDVAIAVECEQVAYDLLFTAFEGGFIHTGSPATLLNRALQGTGFTVGTVQPTGLISVDLKEGITARAAILEITAQCGGELFFDKYTVSLLNRRGLDRGVQFALGKNLKGIVKDVDGQSGEVKTAYEVDIVELRTLPEFEGLEEFELGDTVQIVDEELDINEEQRIVQYTYSPKRRINSKVVIANSIDGIQDTIYRIQTTTVSKDKWMYGVKIGPEEGIVQERYDKKARSIWNADVFKMQKGNGNGSYTDALFFNPGNGEYEFSGIVSASDFIGGSIQIGNNFSVDQTGRMRAKGADFSGDISASIIEGSEIIGGKITSDTDININRDIRVGNNIYLGLPGQTRDRRIEFIDSGPYRSFIGFTNSTKQLDLYAANDIQINSGLNLSVRAAYDFLVNANRMIVPFNTYLGNVSNGNKLVMQSDLSGKVDVEDAGYNLSFDSSTRNLKMYNRYGDLLAQVNIS